MSRKRESYRFGIWWQMAAALVVVFLAGGCMLYGGIQMQLYHNQEEQIAQNLQNIRETTETYIRQLLMLNHENNDTKGYQAIAEDIVRELKVVNASGLSVLDFEGNYLGGSTQLVDHGPTEDLQQAINGKAAFTITYPAVDTMLVYFSMPVIIEDKAIGIIRYQIDTSALFLQGKQTKHLVCQMAASVFAVIFLLLAFLMSRILLPIQKLTKISRQVVQDLVAEQVNMRTLAQLADSKRKDEIGELSRNFSIMLERISMQFQNMQEDKERIIRLLGSRQEFYNNMTHELKTPLTTIQGYAQLMEADQGADRKLTKQGLHQILQESTRMHQMVLQLLEMSDQNTYMKVQPVDLFRMSESVAQALAIKAKRYEMQIQTDFTEPLWIQGMKERLRQVLVNLVDNAIKYGEPHTTILLQGRREGLDILLSVSNFGKGLRIEEQERIFEPFYRVDKNYARERGSSGLGLSICRKIMDEHHGTITVQSSPGQQTTFTIRLRALEEIHEE